MRIRLIAPFRLATAEVDMGEVQSPDASDPGMEAADLTRERDAPRGSSAFGNAVRRQRRRIDQFDTELLVGQLGVAALVVEVAAEVGDELRLRELEFLSTVRGFVQSNCRSLAEQYFPGAALSDRSEVLWVHRIFVGEYSVNDVVPLAYGLPVELSRGATAIVGDGFSGLIDGRRDHIQAMESGLFLATQTWLVHEDLTGRMLDLLRSRHADGDATRKRGARGRGEVLDVSVVSLEARELAGYLRRQRRGLVDAQARIFDVALEVWGVDADVDNLVQRCDSHAEFVRSQLDYRRSAADRRRNALLFGLSLTAISQTIMLIFDFLTGTTSVVGPAPRTAISVISIAIVGFGLALGAFSAAAEPVLPKVGPHARRIGSRVSRGSPRGS